MCLLKNVNHEEEGDPDDVDEVPVVRSHDRSGGLIVGEALCNIRCSEHQKECDQSTSHVQAVESRGEVEGGSIGTAGQCQAFVNELGVFGDLAADEESSHEERDDEPAAQALNVATFSCKDSELASNTGQNQDCGVDARERDVEQGGLFSPQLRIDRSQGEIHREKGCEKHQLAGEPHNRADGNHVRSISRGVLVGSGNRRCISHEWSLSDKWVSPRPDPLIAGDDFLTPDRDEQGAIWALEFYP